MMFYKDGRFVLETDPAERHKAELWCRQSVHDAMANGIGLIVVSNCFPRLYELKPYLNLAKSFNYDVQEIIVQGNFENTHGIPEEEIERQRKFFQFRPQQFTVQE